VATKLFLRSTQNNALGATYFDMVAAAGSVTATGVVNSAASGTEIQWTQTAGGAVLQFISGRVPAGGFTLTSTDISIWAAESNALANAGGRYRVFKRSAAGVETELGGGPFNDGVEFGTSAAEMLWVGNVTDTAFAEDDRILLKLYITNIGTMGASRTCTLTYNGADAATGDSFFNIAETVSFKAEAVTGSTGLATATEAAQAPSGKAIAALGLATNPATGLALSGKAIAALGLATNPATGVVLAGAQVRATALANASEASVPLGSAVPAALATDSAAAQALSGKAISGLGVAADPGTGLALAGAQIRPAGLANATDAAALLGSARPTGSTSGAETAVGLTGSLIAPCAAAAEVEAALALGVATAAGLALDPCQALAFGGTVVWLTGSSADVAAATGLAARALRSATAAVEDAAAAALTGAAIAPAGIAAGSSSAGAMSPIGLRAVTAANDNGFALQLVIGGSAGPVEAAAANDNALALGLAAPWGTAIGAAGAQSLLRVSLRSIELAAGAGTALVLVGQTVAPIPAPPTRRTCRHSPAGEGIRNQSYRGRPSSALQRPVNLSRGSR
jgi:hypothetical protein